MSSKISNEMKSACVLAVDDELPNVKLLERMLSAKGFEHILSTQDPRQVLSLVRDNDVDLMLRIFVNVHWIVVRVIMSLSLLMLMSCSHG